MAQIRTIAVQKNGQGVNSFHVFGERNSGTNYVHHLIYRNCVAAGTHQRLYRRENETILGWKHGFPVMLTAPDDVLAIAVYREPVAWLGSLCRAPWHTAPHLRRLPFARFIRSEWMSIVDDRAFGIGPDSPQWKQELMSDRDVLTGKRFANAMQLRNAKNRGFASLDNRFGNVLRIQYEQVLANPEGFLNALCATYGLKRLPVYTPIVHDRATPARGAYVAKPLPRLAPADLAFILDQLDLPQEHGLGYAPEAHSVDAMQACAA